MTQETKTPIVVLLQHHVVPDFTHTAQQANTEIFVEEVLAEGTLFLKYICDRLVIVIGRGC